MLAVVEAAALVLWVSLGGAQWFYLDEWDFLAQRTAWNLGDLFRPHNEHWSTLPILFYRLLWSVVGIRSYVPYLAAVVVLHLTIAALLWIVMQRAGVQPWIATAAASLFALFGAGHQDIMWAFQIGFDASVMFGILHLLLADHSGPIDRRDWLGLLAGMAGLLCSGIAVTMAVVVGVATFTRRGWRIALFHTVPLAVVYVVWWLSVGRSHYSNQVGTFSKLVHFVATGLSAAYGALGQVRGMGIVFALLLLVGAGVALRDGRQRHDYARLSAPFALLIGSVVVLAVAAFGRGILGSQPAQASRFQHLVAAMALPGLAVAADAVARRWKLLLVPAVAVFVVGIPANVRVAVKFERDQRQAEAAYRQVMLSLPRVPMARKVPPKLRPEPQLAPWVEIGWLLAGAANGRIPPPRAITAALRAGDDFRLSLNRSTGRPRELPAPCEVLTTPLTLTLDAGSSLYFDHQSLAVAPQQAAGRGPVLLFIPSDGRTLTAVVPVRIRISSPLAFFPTTVCGPALRRATRAR